MNLNLQAICDKYNYHLPTVIDQLINRYIKKILKDLSETVPSLAIKVPTKLTMRQKKNKEENKMTHKFTILQMMHVSGHKTEKTFCDYIKLSSDEIADEIDAIGNGSKTEVF